MRRLLFSSVIFLPTAMLPADPGKVLLERVFPALSFTKPLMMQEIPDDTGRLVVVERDGKLHTFDPTNPSSSTLWLDLTDRIATEHDQGLFSIEFSPEFATDGEYYLNYSYDDGTHFGPGRVSRFTMDLETGTTSADSEEILIVIPQPFKDHNGGNISFGPDGMLYIALGDGGSNTYNVPPEWEPPLSSDDPASQDPMGNGQNTENILGCIVRIDVTGEPDDGLNYRIPRDNPFYEGGPAGELTRKEIWAYGFRNPWRTAFDPDSGRLLVADLGARHRDEISHAVAGGNYGWKAMEGDICFPPGSECDPTSYTLPIVSFERTTGPGNENFFRAITGGYFYKGDRVPSLDGFYLASTYLSTRLFAVSYDGTDADVFEIYTPSVAGIRIAGFGYDLSGEVYLLDFQRGGIYALTSDPNFPPVSTAPPTATPTPTTEPTPSPIPTTIAPTPVPLPEQWRVN